jgi:hypothetical protein
MDFYSCFISYSTKDQEFADRLYADLQARGVRCWFAPHDIQGGRKVHEQIDEAIRVYDKLLLILSEDSIKSDWVQAEVGNTRTREMREKRQMLFPISLVPFDRLKTWTLYDADTGKDVARELREYFIPDFSNWKDHESYQRAFERLVRDLKAGRQGDAGDEPTESDFLITFAPGISPSTARDVLTTLGDFYRACGGVGLRIEPEFADVWIEEPIHVAG